MYEVGEGAAAIALAERPDALGRGPQLVVDRDVAAAVDRDAGPVEPEIAGVGRAPDGEQQVRADRLGRPVVAAEPGHHLVAAPFQGRAFGMEPDGDALGLEDRLNGGRDVLVLAPDQPVGHLDHRDPAAEAAADLANSSPT
ncbi:MAG: hypothetical protein U1E53_25835 [Dongiaceae bacterium]